MIEKELCATFLEEYYGANDEFEKERFKNAMILFSKSLFALCDILIQTRLAKLPKNHTERFRLLEEYFPKLYAKVDPLFGAYRDAYAKPILQKTCEKIRNEIREIITTTELPREITEGIKQKDR